MTLETSPPRLIDRGELRRLVRPVAPMGNQPTLDGIRAVSVALVVLYHAGFDWVHGGFLGVEVFFVVSGYLITSLLWEEHHRDGRVSLGQFWRRRARRLLPALFVMLIAVSLWASAFAHEQVAQLRHDLLPALFYVGNWGQILGSVPYFSAADPLLRHVWSLAVEEQWYLFWPVAFIVLVRVMRSHSRRIGGLLIGLSAALMVWSAVLASSGESQIWLFGRHPDRFNFLYLNTFGRSSGLLLGAGLALVWRPWARPLHSAATQRRLDGAGLAAMVAITAIALTREAGAIADASLYHLWLPLVTVLSGVAIAAGVQPGSRLMAAVFARRLVVEVGRRSYGLYLWHWPVFVMAGVRSDHARFVPALVMTLGLTELSYRLVETPIRRGGLTRWWVEAGRRDVHRTLFLRLGSVSLVLAVVSLVAVRVASVESVDLARDSGAADAVFDPTAVTASSTVGSGVSLPAVATPTPTPGLASNASSIPTAATTEMTGLTVAVSPGAVGPVAAETTTTAAVLPRAVTLVGDSQAHALAVNLPKGIGSTFTVSDGSVDGCSVWSAGKLFTARKGFRRSFDGCAGWEQRWARSVAQNRASVALVVLGAWDVFDLQIGDISVPFASQSADDLFLQNLQVGIDAVVAAGAKVALLEVACMRPIDTKGAAIPALPERGDDSRVAHLNTLLRRAAAADPTHVTFIAGPTAWCSDPAISTDTGYRWDGVHVYKPGAKLVFDTIAQALLAIAL